VIEAANKEILLFGRGDIERSAVPCAKYRLCLANTPSAFKTLTFWSRGGTLGSYDEGTIAFTAGSMHRGQEGRFPLAMPELIAYFSSPADRSFRGFSLIPMGQVAAKR
jgi:hypothetical protein